MYLSKPSGNCTQVGGSGTQSSPHPGCPINNPWCDTDTNPPICKCGLSNSNTAEGVIHVICNDLNPFCDAGTKEANMPVCECNTAADTVCNRMSSICQILSVNTGVCRCGGDSTSTDNREGPCTADREKPSCLCNDEYQIGVESAICAKCRKSNGGAGDGSDQGTCDKGQSCYEDGSCRGTVVPYNIFYMFS